MRACNCFMRAMVIVLLLRAVGTCESGRLRRLTIFPLVFKFCTRNLGRFFVSAAAAVGVKGLAVGAESADEQVLKVGWSFRLLSLRPHFNQVALVALVALAATAHERRGACSARR